MAAPSIPRRSVGPRRPGASRRLLAVVAALSVILAPVAPVAAAEPAGGALVDAPTLPWPDLGAPAMLSFYGETSATTLSFAVPTGVTPATLNATVDLPFPMRSGVLTVMQEDRLISKAGLPLDDLAPLVIPLQGVRVVNDSVTLSLTLAGIAEDRFCLDDLNPVDLINGSVTFAGREAAPTTVADFLPGALRKLTIALPRKPSQAESNAAVQLAAELTARYRRQAPELLVIPLADGASTIDAPSLPLERQFVVKEGLQEGLSLQGSDGVPQMLVSGPADKLARQVQLLTDTSINMAVSTRAVAERLHGDPEFPGNTATLTQLQQINLSASRLAPQVNIALDQTKFGHSVQEYRLHLLGTYTPVPATFGGQLVVSVNGEPLDSWPAESGGVIDRWVTVPDRLIQRYTNVAVALNVAGNTGRCNEYQPMTLTLNGNTVVENTPALPPVPAGFGSLPQALMPSMQVGITPESFPDVARAIQIAAGMQRMSVMPLRTNVTSVEEALSLREPAIIVSADGWTDTSITLPVSADGGLITLQRMDSGEPEATLMLDPAVRFGSLQTVFDGQRSLLIATSNGAPDQLDGLLRWLNADTRRWTQVRGNAVVAFPNREPASVMVDIPSAVGGSLMSDAGSGSAGAQSGSMAGWAVAGLLAAVAAGAIGFALSARRAKSPRGGGD